MTINTLLNGYLERTSNKKDNVNIKNIQFNHIKNISQHELMNAIHQEFQRTFIRKLYPQPEWTERIFWNVAGTLQNKYCKELSLNEIIAAIKRYLTEHKMIIPTIKEVN